MGKGYNNPVTRPIGRGAKNAVGTPEAAKASASEVPSTDLDPNAMSTTSPVKKNPVTIAAQEKDPLMDLPDTYMGGDAMPNTYMGGNAMPNTYMGSPMTRRDWLTKGQGLAEGYNEDVLAGRKNAAGVDLAQQQATRQSALQRESALASADAAAARSPGAAQGNLISQRIRDRAMAGAESDALQRQNAVSQLQATGYNNALNRARTIEQDMQGLSDAERAYKTGREDTAYKRADAERAYKTGREDTAYKRADAERAYKTGREDLKYNRAGALRAEKKTEDMAFINSVEDPVAREQMKALQAMGADPRDYYAQGRGMTQNPDGSTSFTPGETTWEKGFASPTSGEQTVKAANDELEAAAKALYTDPVEQEKYVRDNLQARIEGLQTGKTGTLSETTYTQNVTDARRALNAGNAQGKDLQDALNTLKENGELPSSSSASVLLPDNMSQDEFNEKARANGGWLSIGGENYKMKEMKKQRHAGAKYTRTNFYLLEKPDGTTVWYDAEARKTSSSLDDARKRTYTGDL